MARASPTEIPLSSPAKSAEGIYDEHAQYVWQSLYRLGVEARDLPDLTQDVFAVVVRRCHELSAETPMRPWLYGVCVGLVRNYRRRAFRRNERLSASPPERADEARSADHKKAEALLAEIDPEKRAVFVLFEVEGWSGQRIAESLGIPIGTVHSRLHAARRELLDALRRDDEGDEP